MKDELIDTMNAKIEQDRRLLTVSAFSPAGINALATLIITNFKHLHTAHNSPAKMIKSFFWNLG